MSHDDWALVITSRLATVAMRAGLTLRGLAVSLGAIGGVFLAAGASYFLLFSVSLPGSRAVALTCVTIGVVFVSAGGAGVLIEQSRARSTEPSR